MATNATVTCTNDVGKLCTLLGFPTLDSPEQLQMVREHLDRQVLAILESIQEGILVHFLANVLLEAKPSGDHRFKVEKKPSSIPGSGDGVFVTGKAKAGDVVAIYAGTVYGPEDMSLVCDFVFTDNQKDEQIIDGNPVGASQQIYSMNIEKEKIRRRKLIREGQGMVEPFKPNPFAVAHFINHHPSGANVFCFDYEFPLDLSPHLQCYIPNIYFSETPRTNYLVPSLVMIASRDLEDEELFLNYNFNTSNPSKLPDWYRV